MTDLVAIDLGGTHIRFAIATVAGDRVVKLGEPVTLKSTAYDGVPAAWAEYARRSGDALPTAAALSVAGPVVDGSVKLTNLPWRIEGGQLERELGLDALIIINDFEAVGHAVAVADSGDFEHLCGPKDGLSDSGNFSIVGPGTGLGVAQLWRGEGAYRVVPCEGGHIGFAPVDPFEDQLLATLRQQFGRVSVERVAAGPAISDICHALGGRDGPLTEAAEDQDIWTRGMAGADPMARSAVERFCMILGSVAGDLALAHGARGVVIAGGLGRRLAGFLPRSG
ncbi:MAG: glucokinase, partial [Sphingomicrobium sp.]